MAKQILMMTGSPRRKGNSMQLAHAFRQGAGEAGHKVDQFDAAAHPVPGCIACERCWTRGTPCVFDDAFNGELAPLLERADLLVLASPLYFFSLSAQLKAHIDRLYAYRKGGGGPVLPIRESALLLCGADEPEACYSAAVDTYRHIARYQHWQDRGILIQGGVSAPGDIIGTDALERAHALGKSV